MYVPANLYPIMTVISLGQGSPDTIMSGVIKLAEADQWLVAFVIFMASIFIPIFKILVVGLLLASVHFKSSWRPRHRAIAFRITEFIGRWSMIDIFVISILIGLVQLGAIATIEAGPAATPFAAVVILTMLSVHYFDPRIIWDHKGDDI
jgi:paraquat-inducible protein A